MCPVGMTVAQQETLSESRTATELRRIPPVGVSIRMFRGLTWLWRLPFSCGAGKVTDMTAVAAKMLDEFKKLAPDEQVLVRNQVVSLTEARQREALNRLRGASKGQGLLAKLLAERARERLTIKLVGHAHL